VKVYRGQQAPSCSNTSHDHYNLHRSCVPDLCHTTRWLFSGGRVVVPLSGETKSYFYTLWLYTWGCDL
jgi:hypothetical protein